MKKRHFSLLAFLSLAFVIGGIISCNVEVDSFNKDKQEKTGSEAPDRSAVREPEECFRKNLDTAGCP